MRIAFLGFGLIAGSIARAIHAAPGAPLLNASLIAWSPSGNGPLAAVDEGVLEEAAAYPASAVADADLVILAGPPLVCLELVDRLAGDLASVLGSDTVVSDVASTKMAIVAAALVESVATSSRPGDRDWDLARSLAASGWRDTTRLARGDPEMGAGIVATNANALLQRLRDFHGVLGDWLEEVERLAAADDAAAADVDIIRRRFQAARDRLGEDG